MKFYWAAYVSERIQNQDPLTGAKTRASMLTTLQEHYALFQRGKQFGVTVFTESRTVEESIDLADEAMYKAKSAGRNTMISEV